MTPLHFRRSAALRRALVLAALGIAVLIIFCRIRPKFLPEEALDSSFRSTIRRDFKLPAAVPGGTAKRTVPRVHFMHKTHVILPDYRPYISSWRRVYPGYELYFWTDADISSLIARRYPRLTDFYHNQLSNPLERSDFARVLILDAFGGWYADLDAGCQASAENLTEAHSLIVPLEPYAHAMVSYSRRRLVNNAVMYGVPGHPYWMFYIYKIATVVSQLPAKRTKDDAVFSTGPVIMTRAMEQFVRAFSDRCGGGGGGGGGGDGGDDFWCPHVPGPEKFSPLIDTSSHWLANWARVMCFTVFGEPEISAECARLRRGNFAAVLPADAFTYHAFLHLTGASREKSRGDNVSSWALDMRLGPLTYLA